MEIQLQPKVFFKQIHSILFFNNYGVQGINNLELYFAISSHFTIKYVCNICVVLKISWSLVVSFTFQIIFRFRYSFTSKDAVVLSGLAF